MPRAIKPLLFFHALFGVLGGMAIVYAGAQRGMVLLFLAIAYNLLIPAIALWRGYNLWLTAWIFLLPVSVLQIFPDWMLVSVLQTLAFPDLGVYRIAGVVPLYFTLLWIALLLPVTLISDAVPKYNYAVCAVLSAVLFGAVEVIATPMQVWQPLFTEQAPLKMTANVAWYVLLAEMLLGVACLVGYRATQRTSYRVQLFTGMAIPVFYAGALGLSYLLLERIF